MRLSDNVQVSQGDNFQGVIQIGLPIVNLSSRCQKWPQLKLRTGPIDVCKRHT